MSLTDVSRLHRIALHLSGTVVARVTASDLARPTPCAGWDLQRLLGHVIGQNHGFAHAIATPEAPLAAYSDRVPEPEEVHSSWQLSADRLSLAVVETPLDRRVLLVEIDRDRRFPVAMVLGFHLLDTLVHTWDIATALGEDFRPDAELAEATLALARQVPNGPSRLAPGAAFAPALLLGQGDAWQQALALLGRHDVQLA
jgi:uncharacterized protein (TIGR03086 family)